MGWGWFLRSWRDWLGQYPLWQIARSGYLNFDISSLTVLRRHYPSTVTDWRTLNTHQSSRDSRFIFTDGWNIGKYILKQSLAFEKFSISLLDFCWKSKKYIINVTVFTKKKIILSLNSLLWISLVYRTVMSSRTISEARVFIRTMMLCRRTLDERSTRFYGLFSA